MLSVRVSVVVRPSAVVNMEKLWTKDKDNAKVLVVVPLPSPHHVVEPPCGVVDVDEEQLWTLDKDTKKVRAVVLLRAVVDVGVEQLWTVDKDMMKAQLWRAGEAAGEALGVGFGVISDVYLHPNLLSWMVMRTMKKKLLEKSMAKVLQVEVLHANVERTVDEDAVV